VTLQKFHADLLYGSSKTRKTSNCGLVAAWIHAKTGKKARLITADGGGYEPVDALVQAGILDVWVLNDRLHPIEAMDQACQGWWPTDATNPASLVKPPTPDTWKQIGFIAFEGLTSFGDVILSHLRATKARLSQEPGFKWSDGSIEYSGSNLSYYGFVQERLYDFVMKTQMLPVERVLWTGLEGKGEEEGTRAPVYGPAIAGKKSVGKAPQWFGNCLHNELLVTSEVVNPKTKQLELVQDVVMYLRPHADPITKIAFPAGTRAPYQFASELPLSMAPNLAELYDMLDKLKARALQSLTASASAKGGDATR
jgi:hypothetical protein